MRQFFFKYIGFDDCATQYSRNILIRDFDLDPTLSPKESINENDLYNFLIYL